MKITDIIDSPALFKKRILEDAKTIKCPSKITVDENLMNAYCISRAVDSFLIKHYFPLQKKPTKKQIDEQMSKILDDFEADILLSLDTAGSDFDSMQNIPSYKNQNLFVFAGTKQLFLSNKYTRTITTKLGNYLERIADIDKTKSFDTEIYLGLKVKGVDKFVRKGKDSIYHIQVKTKKDTLTGSQSARTVKELGIHPFPRFAASFDLGRNWTFSGNSKIIRISGKEYWDLVGLDYSLIMKKVCNSLQNIEKVLFPD